MYSEANDFIEKSNEYSRMSAALNSLCGKNVIACANLALELGGSGGLLAGLVSSAGVRVICTDIDDVQVRYNGEFPRLIKEKFQRNGLNLDLSRIEFHAVDAQELPYRDGLFDFVFSLNAFEHIPDPLRALNEVSRVLRAGGVFYASFDPVWTADSGSHFMHYVDEPWLHLILTHEEFRMKMRQGGAPEAEVAQYPSAMNERFAGYYKNILTDGLDRLFEKYSMSEWAGCVSPSDVNHDNRTIAARKIGVEPDELLIRGFQIVAVK